MDVTLAIATWNRADLLQKTLHGLAALRIPAGVTWHVLVCDNNSTDHTKAVVEAAVTALHGQVDLRYLFEPMQGKSHALNRMIAAATGDWIFFLDDDVLVEEGWLEGYMAAIARHPRAGCLGGAILPWLEHPAHGTQAFLLREYPYVYGIRNFEADGPMNPPAVVAGGANLALRRAAIPPTGFAADRGMIAGVRIAGEDAAIQAHIVAAGHEAWLVHGAAVRHYIDMKTMGPRRFCEWQAGIGRTWTLHRGKATPGKFGVAWWAWREFLRRALRAVIRWRPWPTRPYFDALKDAAQYWGYLRASR